MARKMRFWESPLDLLQGAAAEYWSALAALGLIAAWEVRNCRPVRSRQKRVSLLPTLPLMLWGFEAERSLLGAFDGHYYPRIWMTFWEVAAALGLLLAATTLIAAAASVLGRPLARSSLSGPVLAVVVATPLVDWAFSLYCVIPWP